MFIKELIGGNSLCAIYSMGKKSFIGLLLGPCGKKWPQNIFLRLLKLTAYLGCKKIEIVF